MRSARGAAVSTGDAAPDSASAEASRAADFRRDLADAGRVHVDAPVLAAHLVGDARYAGLTGTLFAALREGECAARTSAVTVYQLLVEPYRRDSGETAAQALRLLSAAPGLEIVPVSVEIAERAAQVRARLGGSTERALQIATAIEDGAALFLTDRSLLRRVAGTAVATLEAYAPATAIGAGAPS